MSDSDIWKVSFCVALLLVGGFGPLIYQVIKSFLNDN